MEQLLIYREKLREFIASHWNVCNGIGKVIAGGAVFYVTSQIFGYSTFLTQTLVTVLLACLCYFLPITAIYWMANLMVLLQISTISIELFFIYFVALLLYQLLYQRIFPEIRIFVMLTPVFIYFQLPMIIPLYVGVFIGITGLPAIIVGAFVYYFANTLQMGITQLENGSVTEGLYNIVLQRTMNNQELLVCIFSFILVVAIVVALRKSKISYGWYISVIAGGILYLIVSLVGGFIAGTTVAIGNQIILCAISIFVVICLQFFHSVIDYSREEHLEFEDDEYYYYVKAIPKSFVNEEDINITKINYPTSKFGFRKKMKGQGENSD